ncbi:MAG: fibronectin type III domain-containing protein, partial [Eggerthellaceae bacterium]|nr:fibronectin type III domain-containing protein [Eggerthellaceae bacterium]
MDGEGTVSATVTYTDYAKEGDTATLPVTITSANYQPATAKVVVQLTSKTVVGVSIGGAPAGKTYGDPAFELTATLDAGAQADGGIWAWYSSDESVLKVTGSGPKATVEVVGAGSAMIAALYESAGDNGKIGAAVTEAIAVDPRPLTVTAASQESVYVGGKVPALPSSPTQGGDYTIGPAGGGLLTGDEISGLRLDYAPSTPDPTAPGTYAVVPSGAIVKRGKVDVSKNYAIAYANGSLVVKPKETQTITVAEDSIAATYGDSGRYVDASVATSVGAPGALTYAVKDGKDVVAVDGEGVLTLKKAGTATVTVTAAETATHAQATKDVAVAVGKAELVIEPRNREIRVHGKVPALSPVTEADYVAYGLFAGESLVTPPTLSYATEPNADEPGSYKIVASGADAGGDYEIEYQSGWLTIRPKPGQAISADNVTVTYGDAGARVSATSSAEVGKPGAITYAVKEGSGEFIDVDAHTGALTVKTVPQDGRAYVVVTAAETDSCVAASKDVAVNIRKAPSPATVAREAAVKREHAVDLADYVALNGATGEVTYTIEGDALGCRLEGSRLVAGEVAGKVVVRVDVAEDAIHEALAGAVVVTVNGNDSSSVRTAPTALGSTYDGSAHALATAGEAEGGTMVYALGMPDGKVPDEFEFGYEIPSATDVGIYRVWYQVTGDAGHNDSAPAYVDATIAKADISKAKVELAQTSYTYTGKELRPAVKSVTLGGKKLEAGTDYTVSYANSTKLGKATVTIAGKGSYEGAAKATFAIALAKAKMSTAARPKAKAIDVKWGKVASARSYQVQWRERGGKWKTASVKSAKTTVKGLKTGKFYDLRVRAVSGTHTGAWSAVSHCWLVRQAGVAAESTKSGTVKVMWTKTAKANAGYVVMVSYSKDGATVAKRTVAAGKMGATITGLKPGKTAYVQVCSLRKLGRTTYAGALTSSAASIVKVAGESSTGKAQSADGQPARGALLA